LFDYPKLEYPILGYSSTPFYAYEMPKSIFSASQEKLQSLLKKSRIDAKLNQVELSKKLKRPQSFVSKYESGERRLDVVELREICRALKISLPMFAKKFEKSLKA
jgi:ribosome-binding protein aMBF1 (putative translation factor)